MDGTLRVGLGHSLPLSMLVPGAALHPPSPAIKLVSFQLSSCPSLLSPTASRSHSRTARSRPLRCGSLRSEHGSPAMQSQFTVSTMDMRVRCRGSIETVTRPLEVQVQILERALGGAALWGLLQSGAALADEVVEAGSEEVVETVGNGAVSFLFIAAFLGLSILTVGVVYLSVQDFLEKRERDTQAKTAEAKKKDLEVVKAGRPGPKGFGQRSKDASEN